MGATRSPPAGQGAYDLSPFPHPPALQTQGSKTAQGKADSEVLQQQCHKLTQATILVKETFAGAIYRESDISGRAHLPFPISHIVEEGVPLLCNLALVRHCFWMPQFLPSPGGDDAKILAKLWPVQTKSLEPGRQ